MSSTYSNLGIELIGTGEQAGTWGTTTNGNFSNIIDNAVVGYASVTAVAASTTLGTPALLTVSDGAASSGQKRVIEIASASDLGASSYLAISPNDFAGYYFIKNSLLGSRSLIVFQGTWNGTDPNRAVTIENGYEAVIRCNGAGAAAVVSFINYNIKTGSIYASKTGGATLLVQVEGEGSTQLRASRSSTDTAQPLVTLTKSRGTIAAKTIVASGDVLGEVSFWGYDGTQIVSAASISTTVDATPGANDMPGALILGTTADGAGTPTERMRISSAGNVGIGTASPTQKLDVNGNVAITGASRRILSDFSTVNGAGTVFQTSTVNGATNVMAAPNGTGAFGNFVAFSSSDVANSGFIQMYHTSGNGWIATNANGTGAGGYVAISPSGGGSSTRAYFTTTGLGIGTTTPSVSFETVGSSIFGDSIASDTARFNSCVGIGRAPSLSYAAYIQGVNTASTDFALRLDNTAEVLFYVRNDGLITTGSAALSPVNNTTANAANLYTSASGVIFKSTSSLRYKNSVENAKYGITEVMQIRPVTYKGNNDGDKIFGGFIAEEIDAIENLRPFVVYDNQKRPDALAYAPMVSLLTKAIQEQQAMIEALKARISVLEAK